MRGCGLRTLLLDQAKPRGHDERYSHFAGILSMQPSIAIITSVYNEDVLLPIWLRYYGAHLGREHLYVIDDGSNDGSTSDLAGVNVIRLERAPIDEDNRSLAISLFHREMLKHYDVVIFADVDELLVVDPLVRLGLVDYISKHAGPHTNACGFNVIHNQFAEPAYSPDTPVFGQRRFVEFSRGYCKQLIHKEPVTWYPGFHNTDQNTYLGVGLYLFHLRALDFELSRRRINDRNKLVWSERSLRKGQGVQTRLSEVEYLQKFFQGSAGDFERAVPATEFNGFVTKLGQLIPSLDAADPVLNSLRGRLWTLPPRFRDTLPPVVDEGAKDAQRGPSKVSAGDAQAMYFEARAKIDRDGLAYGTI